MVSSRPSVNLIPIHFKQHFRSLGQYSAKNNDLIGKCVDESISGQFSKLFIIEWLAS